MDDTSNLSHTKWECKYHVVWIPKYRKKRLFEELRGELGPVLRELAQHKESAIHIARAYLGRERNFTGQHFWARGYYVSTVEIDETALRQHIKQQEDEDRRYGQMNMFG